MGQPAAQRAPAQTRMRIAQQQQQVARFIVLMVNITIFCSLNNNNINNNNGGVFVVAKLSAIIAPAKSATRPESSSSFFAPIENLTDSTIKTKVATLAQPPQNLVLGPNPLFAAMPSLLINTQQIITADNNINNGASGNNLNINNLFNNVNFSDSAEAIAASLQLQQRLNEALRAHHEEFDTLIQRLLLPLTDRQVFSPDQFKMVNGFLGHGKAVAADVNNKTIMQFFRNNKTFASIVYTNEEQRRLLNCHLVDLERHASDVALFEAKYDMSTNDIEFNEMMNLIEACTDIARQHRTMRAPYYFVAPATGGAFPSSLGQQQQQQLPPASGLGMVPAETSAAALNGGGGATTGGVGVGGTLPAMPAPPPAGALVIGAPPPSRSFAAIVQPTSARRSLYQSSARTFGPLLSGGGSDGNGNGGGGGGPPISGTADAGGSALMLPEQAAQLQLGPLTPTQNGPSQTVMQQHQHPLAAPTPSTTQSSTGTIKEALSEISSYDPKDLWAIWRGILPGTNWCGMGDRATSYNDLGIESDLDICCRAHDFCPIRLSAFSKGYGLFNWSFYTRSHCSCDENFLVCLKRAHTPMAEVVAKFYFNLMRTTCIHQNETLMMNAMNPEKRSHFARHNAQAPPPLAQGSGGEMALGNLALGNLALANKGASNNGVQINNNGVQINNNRHPLDERIRNVLEMDTLTTKTSGSGTHLAPTSSESPSGSRSLK